MAETVTRKHPIRGAVWGFIAGLGVAMLLTVAWPIIALESVSQVVTQWAIVIVIVMVLSVLWGMFGPAKRPKGAPPADVAAMGATTAAAAADTAMSGGPASEMPPMGQPMEGDPMDMMDDMGDMGGDDSRDGGA